MNAPELIVTKKINGTTFLTPWQKTRNASSATIQHKQSVIHYSRYIFQSWL